MLILGKVSSAPQDFKRDQNRALQGLEIGKKKHKLNLFSIIPDPAFYRKVSLIPFFYLFDGETYRGGFFKNFAAPSGDGHRFRNLGNF